MSHISLLAQVKEDFSMPHIEDPAMRSRFEVLFNYPGVWAVVMYRFAHWLYLKNLHLLARFLMGFTQLITNIDIHPAAVIGRRLFIDHGFGVVIGETAIVGDDVLIYQGVTLGGVSLEKNIKRHPTVKNHAVIGAGAKVLGDITMGERSKIGSNSVVVKDVPDDSTAIGIPARVIKKGADTDAHSHNKLPDINKELFKYLIKRVAILEKAVSEEYKSVEIEDKELEEIYHSFIESVD